MPAFVNASNVRTFAGISGIEGQWSEANLGSNIRAASAFLQRATGRQFELQTGVTKTFTTNGEAFVAIPDLRGSSPTITLNGSAMTVGTDVFLVPDAMQTGVYIGLQFARGWGARGYLSHADWFDRNLDKLYTTWQPDDLVVGPTDWGHDPLPDELTYWTKALAAFLTKNPDALLSGFTQTPDGTLVEAGDLPKGVTSFIKAWKVGPSVISVGR